MSLEPALDRAFNDAQARLDALHREIASMDVAVLGAPKSVVRRHHGSAYIWMAATLERSVPRVLAALLDLIESSGVACDKLKPGIWSILVGGQLAALQDLRGMNMLRKRLELLTHLRGKGAASLSASHLPLDGRTLRPEHFDMIWRVFSLDGDALPSLFHRTALTEIADTRNDLAHGKKDPLTIGALKTRAEILRRVGQTGDIIEHLVLSTQDCLDNNRYLH